MSHDATLLMTEFVTHDVQRLLLTRPEGLDWQPGQGVEIHIDTDEWRDEGRPFTPTSLPNDQLLECTTKRYPKGDGMTMALHALQPGAQLKLSDAFGSITYQGPGAFIAAGTGVSPFLGILRRLAADDALDGHRLLLTNKGKRDVIREKELKHYLGDDCVLTFTREHEPGEQGQRIDLDFLRSHLSTFNGKFYVCGPDAFVESINGQLKELGVQPGQLVYEQ
ncbi:Naphthalene 1,2-dioxygenase system ferredoxin--NAD(+) reductase component [Thiorhodovibrio winogradskyi]|uniref:Naphthalene 1,2-dioxygenase system ferredoxin--NAD(+) reductase component n=1 Tax=Thiorhodovibrio winogradskyi TaxID=77007 RepID=A0ABZ0SBL1_9GAMM|nr:FAD-binding oxidoreductase [Thiorhodovibrio winogradskyi]